MVCISVCICMVRPKCQNFLNEYKMSLYCIYKLYYQHNNLSENLHLKIELLSIWYLHSSWHCLQKFLQNLMIHVIQHLKMFHWASYVLRRKKQHLAFGTNLFTFDQWPRNNATKKKSLQSQSFRTYCILYHLQTSGLDLFLNEEYKCERSCSSVRLLWQMGCILGFKSRMVWMQ